MELSEIIEAVLCVAGPIENRNALRDELAKAVEAYIEERYGDGTK